MVIMCVCVHDLDGKQQNTGHMHSHAKWPAEVLVRADLQAPASPASLLPSICTSDSLC